jgi:uncharacterized membrane protein YhiD involved in acid resistance
MLLTTTFDEIFKSKFLENLSAVSITDVLLALLASFILGIFIYFVYKKTFQGVIYSEPFNMSLLLLTMLTTFIILAVTSNVVLSLGMVGALSIVRFRTAIKDPLDLVFLFWAIGGGIVLGAGLFPLALIGSILIGLVLIFKGRGTNHTSYMVICNCEDASVEEKIWAILNENAGKIRLKSKTHSSDNLELIFELQLKEYNALFISSISKIPGVSNIQLVSYNGDYVA